MVAQHYCESALYPAQGFLATFRCQPLWVTRQNICRSFAIGSRTSSRSGSAAAQQHRQNPMIRCPHRIQRTLSKVLHGSRRLQTREWGLQTACADQRRRLQGSAQHRVVRRPQADVLSKQWVLHAVGSLTSAVPSLAGPSHHESREWRCKAVQYGRELSCIIAEGVRAPAPRQQMCSASLPRRTAPRALCSLLDHDDAA